MLLQLHRDGLNSVGFEIECKENLGVAREYIGNLTLLFFVHQIWVLAQHKL